MNILVYTIFVNKKVINILKTDNISLTFVLGRRVSVVMGAVFSSVALVTIIVASIRLRKKCKNSKVDAA